MTRASSQFALVFLLLSSLTAAAASPGRFFIEGDGRVYLVDKKTGAGGLIVYRTPDGGYPDVAHRRIDQIFGISPNSRDRISLRLIAVLDYAQDQLRGGTIRLISGYRSPVYNEGLRQRGALAARTSMHIEGMAADIEMDGVGAKRLWEFIQSLRCCGAGYYHSTEVHIDVGPTRSWDETSTGVSRNLGAGNRLILPRTEWDHYRTGESVRMTLSRITDYPIGIRRDGHLMLNGRVIAAVRLENAQADCVLVRNRPAASSLSWKVSNDIGPTEQARIRVSFCHRPFPQMPPAVDSNPISIR